MQLDQHFMINKELIEFISSKVTKKDTVTEIGPGTGNLTKELSKKAKQVVAVELDSELAEQLKKLKLKNVEIVNENALDYLKKNRIEKIVANIPYSICEPLLNILATKTFKAAIITIPYGFWNKIIESVLFNSFFEIKKIRDVTSDNFFPKPSVMSCVIEIKPKMKPNKQEIFIREIFKRESQKIGNAIRDVFWNTTLFGKHTKREAIQLAESILDGIDKNKNLGKLTSEELKKLASSSHIK